MATALVVLSTACRPSPKTAPSATASRNTQRCAGDASSRGKDCPPPPCDGNGWCGEGARAGSGAPSGEPEICGKGKPQCAAGFVCSSVGGPGDAQSVCVRDCSANGECPAHWQCVSRASVDPRANPKLEQRVCAPFSARSGAQCTSATGETGDRTCGTPSKRCEARRFLCDSQFDALTQSFPLHTPELHGIAAVLPLSSDWVVLAVPTIDQVIGIVDEWTGGDYGRAIADWNAGEPRGLPPNWAAWDKVHALRAKHFARARVAAGEKTLGKVAAEFSIRSDEDAFYRSARHPVELSRAFVAVGGQPSFGALRTDYAIYVYLKLPRPMQNGRSYTFGAPGQRSATLLYDESHTVARSIKTNQLGYLPGADNYAYVGGFVPGKGPLPLHQLWSFEVVDSATGRVVLGGSRADGKIRLRDDASRMEQTKYKRGEGPYYSGERLYELDLSGLTEPGSYFLRVPGVGRSWPFRVSKDVFGEAFYVSMRGLYHQRGSLALDAKHTAWTRKQYHTDPVCESEYVAFPFVLGGSGPKNYDRFDIIGKSIDCKRTTPSVVGGWYDAADYDRNLAHYTVVFDLLNLYEHSPSKFVDGQLHIPESGNGIPDLLDEVEFGLRIWLRSMAPDGGASGAVETWTHPFINRTDVKWAFSRRTRFSSLLFAAGAAQLARLVKPFDPKLASKYGRAAIAAYEFGSSSKHSLGKVVFHAATNRGSGDPYTVEWTEQDWMNDSFLLMAKAQLFLHTHDPRYLSGLDALLGGTAKRQRPLPKPYEWPLSLRDYSPWYYYALGTNDELAKKLAWERPWVEQLVAKGRELAQLASATPYRHTWPKNQDYYLSWGASVHTNQARALLVAYTLTGDESLRTAARRNLDFTLGLNPLGMSWTTGLGFVYPVSPQHEWSARDGIADPVPGLTLYGITENHVYPELRDEIYRMSAGTDAAGQPLRNAAGEPVFETFWDEALSPTWPEHPVWRRFSAHDQLNTPECEFTVHETISSMAFTAGMLMSEGWMPSAQLKARGPKREAELFGKWYLP